MAKKAKRASNGMGSVRQRADGRWEGRYSAPDGRQRSVYGKTEAEVTKKLKAVLREIDTGAWLNPSRMTVSEWMEIWLRDYQSHTTGRTQETYEGVVNRHFVPTFGIINMASFSQIHVRRMITNMQKKGLSPSTIRHARGILSASMNSAIEAGLIKANPVDGVRIQKAIKPKFTIVDRDMFPAFIAAAQDTKYPNEAIFLLMTGLRAGELRGLRWDDIDLDDGIMRVERQLHAATHSTRRFGQPKDGEVREVHLTPEAVELLKQQRKRQIEQKVKAGPDWQEDDISTGLVFRREYGQAHNETSIYREIHKIAIALNMPDLHPHDLRHSYAVAALRSGVDVKTVQHNLGHRNAAITLDTYAAYTSDAGKEGAEKLSEYWKNATN